MSFFSSLSLVLVYDSCRYFFAGVARNCNVLTDLTQLKSRQTVNINAKFTAKVRPRSHLRKNSKTERSLVLRRNSMNRIRLTLSLAAFLVAILLGTGTVFVLRHASAAPVPTPPQDRVTKSYPNFELDVLVNGRPLQEYYARGRTYIEALQGSEYELRLRNGSSERVAVALSVDGLNTIDARHTTAWNASKWVIEPYQTITISGWQMSSERARRFYFTNERDSYGAKLGQTANLGVISAVFFREQRRVVPVTPPYPISKNRDRSEPQEWSKAARDGVAESRAADRAPA